MAFQSAEYEINKQSVLEPLKVGFDDVEELVEFEGLEVSDSLEAECKQHEKVTQEIVGRFHVIGGTIFFLQLIYSMRTNIFVLYARSFDDFPNAAAAGAVLYLSYVVSGIASFVAGYFGDRWRFDYILCIAAFSDILTFTLEASATNFWMLAIPYIIGGQALQSIARAYATEILPLYYAKLFQVEIAQWFFIGSLFGPILSGIISYFIGYRAVFILSALLSIILFLICYFNIAGTNDTFKIETIAFAELYNSSYVKEIRNEFHQRQTLKTSDLEDKIPLEMLWIVSDDYRFPIALACDSVDKDTDTYVVHSTSTANSANNTNSANSARGVGTGDYAWEMSKYEFYIFVGITLTQSVAFTSETAMTGWFTAYMKDKYNVNVLYSTAMLSFAAIAFSAGIVTVQKLFEKYKNSRNIGDNHDSYGDRRKEVFDFSNYLVIVVIVAGLARVVLSALIIPENVLSFGIGKDDDTIDVTMWIYVGLYAYFFALIIVGCNIMLVDVTPPRSSGKIVGTQVGTSYCVRSIGALVVGCLWDLDYDALWYTIAALGAISVATMAVVAAFERSRSH